MHRDMEFLGSMVRIESAILVAGFAAIIVWRILRGALRPAGRLAFGHLFADGVMGLIRLQALVASLVFALVYLASTVESAGSGALPPVPGSALALMASSQAAFTGAAVWRFLRQSGTWRNEGEK